MTRRSAAAFHQLPDDCLSCSPWTHELNGQPKGPTGALLEDWDYLSTLVMRRHVALEWDEASKALDLNGTFDAELLLEVGTGRGNPWRDVVLVQRAALPYGAPGLDMAIEVPSRLVSHQLSLRTSVLLVDAGAGGGALSPTEPGSRLWSDRVTTRTEGEDPRFPMEVVDFDAHFTGRPHQHAPWFVNWSPAGAHRDFRGAIRLYLNTSQPGIVDRVQSQEPFVLQAIMSDVVSQVCEGLLRSADHAGELEEAEPGSLAEQARHWVERAFDNLQEAKSVLDQRPGEFRAALLASVRLEP